MPIEYPLDGIPTQAWTNYRTSIGEAGTVLRYKTDDIEGFLSSKEVHLRPEQRLEIQRRVAEWLRNFRVRAGRGN